MMDAQEQANQMVKEGDIVPSEYRNMYKRHFGTVTKLTDEQIALMVFTSEDDMAPDEWALEMKKTEEGL